MLPGKHGQYPKIKYKKRRVLSKYNLLHDCSSDPSGQSSSPSQCQWPWTQVPSVQRNIFPEQTGIGRVVVKHLSSSELSAQSGSPSHFHRDGIQFWLSQVNWSSLQVFASDRKRKVEKSDKWHYCKNITAKEWYTNGFYHYAFYTMNPCLKLEGSPVWWLPWLKKEA